MTDTNTPRDGLTDIDNALESGEALCDRVARTNALLAKEVRSAFQLLASIARRAADREARPAPASVEALRVEAKRLAREVRIKLTNQCVNPSQKNVRACDAADAALADCIDRLAAASTPPAEAQPAESKRSTDAWNKVRAEARTLAPGRGLGDLLTAVLEFGAAQAADPHARFLYGDDATPPASEARATGDAAAELAAMTADRDYWRSLAAAERNDGDEARDALAALSDRSTGAVPAGVMLLYCRQHGRTHHVDCAECGRYIDARCAYLEENRAALASAPVAPPVAPLVAGTTLVSEPGAAIAVHQVNLTDAGRAALTSNLDSLPGSAATGAAGEPQPREGWKWVPVEPTKEMVSAGDRFNWPGPSAEVYRAMLAAVPQADSGAAGERCPQCPHPSACQVHDECLKRSAGGQGDKP